MVYTPKGGQAIDVDRATVGQSEFEQQANRTTVVPLVMRDYLIAACDLMVNGTPHKPDDGDTITVNEDGFTRTYTVAPPGGDTDAATWSDPGQTTWRIHTKLTKETPQP